MIHKPTTPKIYTPQDGSCVLNLDARDVRGSKIYDRSGKGNHGAITGAVLKSKNYGVPALKFDGVDDYINCGNDPSLDLTTEAITISFFINLKDNYQQECISKMASTGTGNYLVATGSASSMMFVLLQGTWANKNQIIDPDILPLNVWSHYVFTSDGSKMYMYKNGVEVASMDQTIIPIITTNNLEIGTGGIWGHYMDGSIADVRIYNRAMLAAEISKYFNQLRHLYGI